MDADHLASVFIKRYEKGRFLGKGEFGEVYEYKDKTTGTPVAIKQISGGSSAFGANLGAIKEIQALREMKHPNIIELIDVFPSDNMVLAVLEFCPSDVETLINDRTILLNLSHVKSILRMLLLGVQECHKVGYMHRDIKPGNMMFGFDGVVKLADFGLAAPYGTGKPQSPEVVTLWYRAPELLFGASYYTEAVDVWAVGCVFAELLLRRPLFPGPPGDTLLQVAEIVRVLGNPSPDGWKGVEKLPRYAEFQARKKLAWEELFPDLGAEGIDLLERMLQYNPSSRITVAEALKHEFFSVDPHPAEPSDIPRPGTEITRASAKGYYSQSVDGGVGVKQELAGEPGKRVKLD